MRNRILKKKDLGSATNLAAKLSGLGLETRITKKGHVRATNRDGLTQTFSPVHGGSNDPKSPERILRKFLRASGMEDPLSRDRAPAIPPP